MLAAPACRQQQTATADVETEEILFADPTVFVENGKYYLTGTRETSSEPFTILESDDMITWRPVNDKESLFAVGEAFGTKGFWAPQIIKENGKYLLAYTANEQTAIACADSIGGSYTGSADTPIDISEKNIDPFLFRDDDGKWYIYHVRFNNGNFIWVGEFDPATGKIIPGTLTQCFANTQPWEATPAYESGPIMEGPTVIKIDDTYYLFYSANHFMSVDYAMGYATAPTPTGPWTKNPDNPVIHRSTVGENGSGHGDIFTDKDGNMRYVYHVHNSDTVVGPRRTRIATLNLRKTEDGAPYSITVDSASIIKPVTVK